MPIENNLLRVKTLKFFASDGLLTALFKMASKWSHCAFDGHLNKLGSDTNLAICCIKSWLAKIVSDQS